MRLLWALVLGFPLLAADVAVAPQSLSFAWQFRSQVFPPAQGILLTSPEPFAFRVSRPAGDGWLLLPSENNSFSISGTGPMFVPININPAAISPGTYTSTVTVGLAQGSISIPVTLFVSAQPILLTDRGILGFDPSSLLLTVYSVLSNGANAVITTRTQTPWLTLAGTGANFFVSADPVRAGPALAAGSVEISGFALPGPSNNPVNLPAVFMPAGLASKAPLTVNPPALAFTGPGTLQATVIGGAFTATSDSPCATVSVVGQTLSVAGTPTAADTNVTVVLNSGGVLQALPVTLTGGAPAISKVVNAASYAEGAIAPGEVVTLFGSNLGPCTLTGLTLDANGFVSSTLAGVQVKFDGVAAPLIYVTATQVAAVVPYDVDGRSSTSVQVTVGGRASNTVTVPVAAAAPGIFTADASGTGSAAAFRTGDVVTIYVTGEGQTTPAGVNGKVTSNPPLPKLPVIATIDGQPAEVLFAGEAPGIVSGVMQVNLRAASGVRTGPVPVAVTVGGVAAQSGVTVSVR